MAEDSKFLFDCEPKLMPQFKGIIPVDKKDGIPETAKPASLADAVKMHFESNNGL